MKSDTGVAAPVLLAVFALVALVVCGIGLELWRVVDTHQRLQGLAEGAALSGASALDVEALYAGASEPLVDADEATTRACSYLASHGAPDCGSGSAVSAEGTGVEVTIDDEVPLTLLRLVDPGDGTVSIRARAVAHAHRSD